MMARAINPARRLYSIAVAPDSSRRNFPSIRSLSNFDGNGLARRSCCQDNQKRKIANLLELQPGADSIAFGRGLVLQTDVFWRARAPRYQRDPSHIRNGALPPL